MADKKMMELKGFKKQKEFFQRKETKSVLLIIAFLILSLASMFVSPQLMQESIHEGDIALKNIYAPYAFTYFWDIDHEKTDGVIEAVKKQVPYCLDRSLSSEDNVNANMDYFFKILATEKTSERTPQEKIDSFKESLDVEVSGKSMRALLDSEDINVVKTKTLGIMDKLFLEGIISEENKTSLTEKGVNKVILYDKEKDTETERVLSDVLDKSTLKIQADNYAAAEFPQDRKMQLAVVNIIESFAGANLEPDEKKTETVKQEAIKSVEPIYKKWSVEKNELIVEKGKRVDARDIAQLKQLRRFFRPGMTPTFFLGVLLLFLLLGLIAAINIFFTQKANFLSYTRKIAIVLLNMFLMIVVADFILRSPQPSYFIPLASLGMMLTLLVGFDLAFLSVVMMSILISMIIGGKIEIILILLVGSVVGMFAIKDVRRRGQILGAGLLAGIGKFLAISCIGLINGMDIDFYTNEGIWGVASGLLSGFIVLGLLPVFEYLFKVPTNISLLELSDLNHPLLKKLAVEAPGTYHHSIMVGNLAEAACDAIGANSLLARVGAYYHDIGKIPMAEYFSENEMGAGSRHSKLAPSMSALIISKHVKEGEEIAKKYKLNKSIMNFITQHHGNSLIYYFYQKAVQNAEEDEAIKEENFRYPGPKPQTKESAIILLADSVEASSRTLEEPTPASIRNLVKKIINNKFVDGQLDECDLTLKDIDKIVDSFVRVLMGIFHTRLTYPEQPKKSSNGVVSENGNGKLKKSKQKKKD